MTVLRWEMEILKLQGGWNIEPCASDTLLSVPRDRNEIGNLDLGTNKMLELERFQTLEGDRDRKRF